ncbi:MAG: tetratricopeptide repeat protein [Myxococcaceae bacterium]
MSPLLFTALLLTTPQPVPPGPPPDVPDEEVVRRLDELFARRDAPDAAAELDALTRVPLKRQPPHFDVLWRVARHRFWISETETWERRRMYMGQEIWDLSEKAIAQKPHRVEGHYFACLGVGISARGIGMLNALRKGMDPKFRERLQRAIQLDPTFWEGAPMLTEGRYHFETPWPIRNLAKSAEVLRKAVAQYPKNVRARYYLAETLLEDGKKAEAKAELEKVVAEPGTDPIDARRVHSWAKLLLVKANAP